jgi:hypothetical protein
MAYSHFYNLYYPSDMPAILFFTLGLSLLYARRWLLFYPLFVLATFNRETSCFLTLVFVLAYWGRIPLRTLVSHALAQAVLWVAIKSFLRLAFPDNPGFGAFDLKFAGNMRYLADVSNLPFFLSSMGFILLPTLLLVRRVADEFTKRSILLVIPFFLGMTLVGNLHELRIYGELIPVVLTALILIVRDSFSFTGRKEA